MEVVCAVVDGDVTVATVRIEGDVPGLFVVDAIARLDVAARRIGYAIRLRDPTPELCELLDLLSVLGRGSWQQSRGSKRGGGAT